MSDLTRIEELTDHMEALTARIRRLKLVLGEAERSAASACERPCGNCPGRAFAAAKNLEAV